MTSTIDLPEIVDSLTAIICSPLIIPVAEAVKQPVVKTTIREGMALSERLQQAIMEAEDVFANVAAEVNTYFTKERREKVDSRTTQQYLTDGKSEVAQDFLNVMSDFNSDVSRMTNGVADLRLLVPVVLGLFTIRQLLKQGLQLEEIPWYVLAWFTFDTFVKLNKEYELRLSNLPRD
ncbi:DUF5132 domain-containing protein [Nostocales cyanobacterium LEGE 11386]|nr:DUF5132 domain-containing protein [Nostocales cyanobacterium LEGE 11386]